MIWLALACTRPALPPGGAQPDVILLSVDTLRADHVGAYGYARDTTPFLDQLAAEGTRFAHARSPSPWTLPSHVTLLSGQLPHRHGVIEDDRQIPGDLALLTQAYADAGYATCGAVATLFVGARFGFDRGFDGFEDFGVTKKSNLKATVDAQDVVDAGLDCVRAHPEQPVFVFLHVYDAHYPYAAPGAFETLFDRAGTRDDATYRNYRFHRKNPLSDDQMAHQIAQYDEEIRYVDSELERLVTAFRSADRPPWVVVTADHGEEFGERGSWGHAHTLYAEQLRVPLVVNGPGVQAQVIDDVVGLHDVAPTLAGIIGVPWDADGVDLGPTLRGEGTLPDRAFPAETSRFETNRIGVWQDGLRLEWNVAADRTELFVDDPEAVDVSAERPQDVARLQAAALAPYGTPWRLDSGALLSTSGVLFVQGARASTPWAATEPTPFVVVPPDATITLPGLGVVSASAPPPEGGPLHYVGGQATSMELTEAERQRLEALGYMQP